MKKLTDYKLVIWDLDGTLYFQKEFRVQMIKVLLKKLVLRPNHWKEILVILKYRKVRENWDATDTKDDLEKRQYDATGKACHMSPKQVESIVSHWMLQEPLQHLYPYRDEHAVKIIEQLQERKIATVVYSDYPTKDKLAALGIEVLESFAANDKEIGCMKPNPKGIEYIMDKYHVDKNDTLMIGDRMEKDGQAAMAAGVDCLILEKSCKNRQKQYKTDVILER